MKLVHILFAQNSYILIIYLAKTRIYRKIEKQKMAALLLSLTNINITKNCEKLQLSSVIITTTTTLCNKVN